MPKQAFVLVAFLGVMACGGKFHADKQQVDTTVEAPAGLPSGRLLSAFFGLDNELPMGANLRVCLGAWGADGMPVIFDREVDVTTVQAGDFRVVTKAGKMGSVKCVTMMPATDPGELRTALLVGDFGSAKQDPPATVEIVGNLLSMDRQTNYRGARIAVTPLAAGPTLVLAELVPEKQWKAGQPHGSIGNGSGCPAATRQALRVVWAGGIRKPNGEEVGDAERQAYRVEMQDGAVVMPTALGDLEDGDNNHLLCFDAAASPKRVSFPAGKLVDPNRDLNPETSVVVSAGMGGGK